MGQDPGARRRRLTVSVFLIANLEIKASGFARFIETTGALKSIVEKVGWRLAGGYMMRTGHLNTIVNIWELDDFNHMNVGWGAIMQDPTFPAIQAALAETVTKETLSFADALTYPAP